MRKTSFGLALGLVGLVIAACGSSSSKTCVYGMTVSCACGGGVTATQTCTKGGMFGVCHCPGTSGAAGAGGPSDGGGDTATAGVTGEAGAVAGTTGEAGATGDAGATGTAGATGGGGAAAGVTGGAGTPGTAGDAGVDAPVDHGTGGVGVDAGGDAPAACTPPAPATDYSCTSMARFTAAKQVVDGIGDEFCDIPAVHYTAANAPYREGHTGGSPPPATPPPEDVTFRAAWSLDAFHLHAHVNDPSIYESNDDSMFWNGDEVEVFVAGGPNFTVTYPAGTDANSMEVGIVPPNGLTGARAIVYLGQSHVALDAQYYAARLVPGGYEIELQLPWAGTAKPTMAGDTMGFYFGLSTQDTPGVGREEYASLPVPAVAGSTCPISPPLPWCDDRTWCHPILE